MTSPEPPTEPESTLDSPTEPETTPDSTTEPETADRPAPVLPPWARHLTGGAAVATALLTVALVLGDVPLRHALLLPVLLLLLPAVGVAQAPLVKELGPEDRASLYGTSGVTILLLGGLALAAGISGPGPEAMGLVRAPATTIASRAVILTMISGALLLLFHLGARLVGYREPAYLEILLPRTAGERVGFALLSVAAGTGEEAAFRAYGVATVAALTGSPALAVGLTSLSFGLLHGYQGPIGVARTASLGALFALSLLWWGSVLPAMAAHTLVDWAVGLWLGERLLDADLV